MSTATHHVDVEEKLDIRKYLIVLRRRAWWGIIPFTILLIVFAVICFAVPPKYLSHCVIKASKSEVVRILTGGDTDVEPTASSTIINEQMMRYESVMAALADTDLMNEVETLSQENPEERGELEDRLYNRIVKNLAIEELGQSKILMRVSYLGDTPGHAVTVLRKLVSHFIENALKREREDVRTARDRAFADLTRTKETLDVVESQMVTFHQDHPGITTGEESGKRERLTEAVQLLQQVDQQIASARRKFDRYTEQIQGMPAQTIDQVKSQQNPEVLIYRERLANLRMSLAAALRRFTRLHPSVKALKQEVEATEQELARARRETAEEDEVTLTRNEVRGELVVKSLDLEASLDALTEMRRNVDFRRRRLLEEVRADPGLVQQLTKLRRAQEAARAGQEEALTRFRRVNDEYNNTVEGLVSFSVIRPARRPHTKDIKHILKLAIVGLVASVAAAFGAIAGTEFLDQSFTDVDAARNFLRLPSLGVIPYIQTPRDRRNHWIKLAIVFGSIVVTVTVIVGGMYVTKTNSIVWDWIKELCKDLA